MKIFFYILVIIFLQNCSFDNKSGIWENSSTEIKKTDKNFKDFKQVVLENENFFNDVVELKKGFKFFLTPLSFPKKWNDLFFNENNINANYSYSDENQIIFQSKKISRNKINKNILYNRNLLVASDDEGNIIVYSMKHKKILHKYNFYKKKFKNIEIKLYYILKDNYLYVSDNIGYLYAYDFYKNKIIWAKNYKIPFRGNLKIFKNKLVATNQNNSLFIFNKSDGNILKTIPTEETVVKNKFKNNLAINNKTLFLINTFGSVYSVDLENLRINWFINLNESISLNNSNLFYGSPILSFKNKLIVSSNQL